MGAVLIFGRELHLFYGMERYAAPELLLVSRLEQAKEILRRREVTAVVIDLEGQEREGRELAVYLRGIHKYYLLPLIFLSKNTHGELMAFHAYHCYDYVQKPIKKEPLMELLNLLSGRLEPHCIPAGLVLRCRDGVYRIDIEDIAYVEILNHRLVVHTPYDKMVFPYHSLMECIRQSRGKLVRCHRAVAVNSSYVKCLDYSSRWILLKKGLGEITIGRTYIDSLRARFDEKGEVPYT